MAIYAVGDVHGCGSELEALLHKVQFSKETDELWFVGDLINRGPRSLDCLRLARELDAKMVLGNHDLAFLGLAAGTQKAGKRDTHGQILKAPDCDELIEWLRKRPLFIQRSNSDVCMAHAGILPQWSIADAQRYSDELSEVLSGGHWKEFMAHMYGNTPARFDESLTGWDRLRAIANVFTRMRFIAEDGTLDFSAKLGPDKAPKGFKPWFQYPRQDNPHLLFGHWAALMGKTEGAQIHVDGLDTGCAWGGSLTLMNLDTGERTSVPAIK